MKLYGIFFVFMLLALPAYASEDGEYYDETFDFNPEDAALVGDYENKDIKVKSPRKNNKSTIKSDDEANQTKNIFIPPRPEIQIQPQQPVNDTNETDSLTDQLKSTESQKKDSFIDGTWIEKLSELSPNKLLGSDDEKKDDDKISEDRDDDADDSNIEGLMRNYRNKTKNGKSNASVFDIAGVMLRMNAAQSEDILTNRGFKKINARFQIPNFIKWRNEEKCRISGIVGYERTQACVIQKAKKDGVEYVQYMKFAKFETKEEIEIYLTSNFTENKVYKIEYRSSIASINGNSPKAVYIRNLKIYDFWRKINRKYGVPDDKTMVTWGLGGNKPYLKAKTGWLKLEDPMFVEMDYTRMSREDKRFINSDFYNF